MTEINPLQVQLEALAAAGATAATLPLLVGLPVPALHFPLSDPDVGTGNFVGRNSRAPGTNDGTSYQTGSGVTGGATSILRGLPQSTSTMFTRSALGVCGSGNTLDNAGATALSIYGVMAPNGARSGSAYWMDMLTKVATASPYAGYRFGLYWTGTAMVLYFRLQSAVTADYIEVRGTTDMANRTPRFVAATYDGTKFAAGVSLYYVDANGVLQKDTPSVASDTFASGDTATNTGSIALGGMGGTQTASIGQYFDGWMSSWTPQLALLSQPSIAALAAASPAVFNKQVYAAKPATPQSVIIVCDATNDIDDLSAWLLDIAMHIRGEKKILGLVVSSSQVHSAAVMDAVAKSRGLTFPIAAYQGSDRISTSAWADAAYTAFGLTKTPANYSDPVTLLRTLLAAQPNGSVVFESRGPLQVEAAFLQSASDGIYSDTGSALMAAKCTRWHAMCGYLAGGSEYNMTQSPASGAYVFANNPVPIYVTSYENQSGTSIAIPGNATIDPARAAFEAFSGTPFYRGTSYDALEAYAAGRFTSSLMTTNEGAGGKIARTNTVNASTGANAWSATAGTHYAYTIPNPSAILVAMETMLAETSALIVSGWSP